MHITTTTLFLLLTTAISALPAPAPEASPAILFATKREAEAYAAEAGTSLRKPIHAIHYCYEDGRCFPEDYKKSKREAEAEALKPIKKIQYCYGDAGACVELKAREANAEPLKPIKKIQYCYGDAGACVPLKTREADPEPEAEPLIPIKPCPHGPDCPPPEDGPWL